MGAACAVALVAPQLAAAATQSDTTVADFNGGTLGANLHVSYAARADPAAGHGRGVLQRCAAA